jgi:hypothetical protein
MDPMDSVRSLAFDRQAVYRIRVEGSLQASWSGRLADMTISLGTSDEGIPTTTLLGELRDQASLAGVLKTLYELHCPVLLVQRLGAGENAANEAAPSASAGRRRGGAP